MFSSSVQAAAPSRTMPWNPTPLKPKGAPGVGCLPGVQNEDMFHGGTFCRYWETHSARSGGWGPSGYWLAGFFCSCSRHAGARADLREIAFGREIRGLEHLANLALTVARHVEGNTWYIRSPLPSTSPGSARSQLLRFHEGPVGHCKPSSRGSDARALRARQAPLGREQRRTSSPPRSTSPSRPFPASHRDVSFWFWMRRWSSEGLGRT
jgi:hypothetical protein